MLKETLVRALAAVREKLADIDENVADWLAERERRRRTQAFILRGIVRIEGSQRKAAAATGISQAVISRILDRDGHKKQRASQAAIDVRSRDLTSRTEYREALKTLQRAGSNYKGPEPMEPTNVVPLRKRRPDWKPRDPRRTEIRRWFEQYLGWSDWGKAEGLTKIIHFSGSLPNAAYYTDESADGDGSVGQEESAARRRST